MNAMTPGSMLGGFGTCTSAILREPPTARKKTGAPKGAGPKESPSRLRFRPRHRLTFRLGSLRNLFVRPFGAASTYSRCALGADVNLGQVQSACKSLDGRKVRILRTLNNQHFHSALCSLWKSRRAGARGDSRNQVVGAPGCTGEKSRSRVHS